MGTAQEPRAIASRREPGRVLDPDYGRTCARVARLYAREGHPAEAIARYEASLAHGYDAAHVRSRLALLHLKQRQWSKSSWHAWQATKLSGRDVKALLPRIRRRLRLTLRARFSPSARS